jgi:hypothetical protein
MPTLTLVQSWLDLFLPGQVNYDLFVSSGFVGFHNFPPWDERYMSSASATKLFSSEALQELNTFWKRYSAIESKAARGQLLKKPGNDKEGKARISEWINIAVRKWKVQKILEDHINIGGIMEAWGTRNVSFNFLFVMKASLLKFYQLASFYCRCWRGCEI